MYRNMPSEPKKELEVTYEFDKTNDGEERLLKLIEYLLGEDD